MKEINININVNTGGVVSVGLCLLTFGGLTIYFAEKGCVPYFRNDEFSFEPLIEPKQIH